MRIVTLNKAGQEAEDRAQQNRLKYGRYTIIEAVETLLDNDPAIIGEAENAIEDPIEEARIRKLATRKRLIDSLEILIKDKKMRDFTHVPDQWIAPLTSDEHSFKEFNTTVGYEDLNAVWLPLIGSKWHFPNPLGYKSSSSTKDWKSKAQEIGEQYLDDYGLPSNLQDRTLDEISGYVLKQLISLGYKNGKGGMLTSSTVKRESLQGDWYQHMIAKGKTLQK
jgi:hypothetical protein